MRAWFRVLGGYGLSIKPVSEMKFSERYRYTRFLRIGPWIINGLKRGNFERERLKGWRVYWGGTKETLARNYEIRRIDEIKQ